MCNAMICNTGHSISWAMNNFTYFVKYSIAFTVSFHGETNFGSVCDFACPLLQIDYFTCQSAILSLFLLMWMSFKIANYVTFHIILTN